MSNPITPKAIAVASLVALTSITASTSASAQVVFNSNIFNQNFNGATIPSVKAQARISSTPSIR